MKFNFLAIAILWIALFADLVSCSGNNEQGTMMLTIDPAAIQLTNEIERRCGHEVVWKVATDPSQHDNMAGAIFEGYNPVVRLNRAPQDIPSAVIYHELLHLYLMAENEIYRSTYASPLFDHMSSQINDLDKLDEVFLHAHSILHHAYIFPKMIGAGYHVKESFDRFDEYANYPPYEQIVIDYHVAIDVWHLKAGQVDGSMNLERHLLMIQNQFPTQYEHGLRLYGIAKSFDRPKMEAFLFSEILEELFSYDGRIQFTKGNKGNDYNIMAYF
jgi:hypothetical protein